jgi:hypothetical protein
MIPGTLDYAFTLAKTYLGNEMVRNAALRNALVGIAFQARSLAEAQAMARNALMGGMG